MGLAWMVVSLGERPIHRLSETVDCCRNDATAAEEDAPVPIASADMSVPIGLRDVREAAGLIGNGWERLKGRLLADHQTIQARRLPGTGQFMGGFFTIAIVVPSRRVRPLAASDLVDAAVEWVNAAWPGALDGTVARFSAESVRFEALGDDGRIDVAVEVRPTGLVETLTRVPSHERDSGVHLDLVDVLRPVATLGRAIREPRLRRLWGGRRMDWHVNLSAYEPRDKGPTSWTGLILPLSTTALRASNAYPVTPANGFAPDRLRGWPRRQSLVELMTLAAEDLLVQCGYYAFGEAAAEAARLALRPTSVQGVR